MQSLLILARNLRTAPDEFEFRGESVWSSSPFRVFDIAFIVLAYSTFDKRSLRFVRKPRRLRPSPRSSQTLSFVDTPARFAKLGLRFRGTFPPIPFLKY